MQEQSPLRPAEFVRIRDGLIAFLLQPPGTPIERVIPQRVVDAMVAAALRGRKRRRALLAILAFLILIGLAGAILSILIDPILVGLALLLCAVFGLGWSASEMRVRDEFEIDELGPEPDVALQRNLRALDSFRALLASGEMQCEERLPDGTLRPLSANTRRSFLADHGALLILSRDPAHWACIPTRPVPKSPLWVRLGGSVAAESVTSRTLIDTPDPELFNRRIEWLLSRANQANPRAASFREAIQIIVALRRPDLEDMTFERKKEVLRAEGVGESRVEKIHAGVYGPFNRFLASLPMHECP
jgi:hypothetical protein